jgi:hypothetical protein
MAAFLRQVCINSVRSLSTSSYAPKAWQGSIAALETMKTELPTAAIIELTDWVQNAMKTNTNPDDAIVVPGKLPAVTAYVKDIEQRLLIEGPGLALIKPIPLLANDMQQVRALSPVPLVQSSALPFGFANKAHLT